jgi:hypothetical protein
VVVATTAILLSSVFVATAILSSDFSDGQETTSPDAVVATAIISCGDDDQIMIINRLNRRTLPGGERSSRSNGRTGRVTGRTRQETTPNGINTNGINICPLATAPRRLSSRRGGILQPTGGPAGGSSRMTHGNTNGRAAANGGRLSREGKFGVGG